MINRTDWFYEAGFGMFCHWTTATLPENGEKKDYHKAVEDFDLDTFVSQVVSSGAKFLFFTASHSEMHLPFPLPELDEILPNHTSKRDLIMELADALEPHGIKLMLYFNGDGCTDIPWQDATYTYTNREAHAEYCYKIAKAISMRYGKKIHGWWIDCCYVEGLCSGYGTSYDFKRYAEALRAGNPDSIVAFNFKGIEEWDCDWGKGISDYQAGEENYITRYPNGRYSGEGELQWFALCWMDDFWVHEKEGEPAPRYSNEEVLDYINKVRSNGGVFAYNVAPYQEGHIAPKTAKQLKWLGKHLG